MGETIYIPTCTVGNAIPPITDQSNSENVTGRITDIIMKHFHLLVRDSSQTVPLAIRG